MCLLQAVAGDDTRIVVALETRASTVCRTRRQLVEDGLEAALTRKKQQTPSASTIFDGEAEAELIAQSATRLLADNGLASAANREALRQAGLKSGRKSDLMFKTARSHPLSHWQRHFSRIVSS